MHTFYAVYEHNKDYVVRVYQAGGYSLHRQVPGTISPTRKGADSTARSLRGLDSCLGVRMNTQRMFSTQ